MKRKALTGLAALTLFDIAAAAQSQAQAQVPPPSWTGFYAGVNAGYRWSNVTGSAPVGGLPQFDQFGDIVFDTNGNPVFTTISAPFSINPQNAVAGFHGGYNFQLSPITLVGWEADFNWGRGSGQHSVALSQNIAPFGVNGILTGSGTFSATVDWSASLRGRLGYINGPWLFYGTAGLSLVRMSISAVGGFNGLGQNFSCDGTCVFAFSSSSTFSASKVLAGAIIGTGLEYLLDGRWMVRVEYLVAAYGNVNFGNANVTSTYFDNFFCGCTYTATSTAPVTASLLTQTLRFGLSLKIP